MSNELLVILTASLPVSELRGAIPLGVIKGVPLIKTTLLSILGNMIPIIPLLLFLRPVSEKLRKIPILKKFFDWLFKRAKDKAELIEKYEAIGLALFVAVPLPMTGAWTGAIIASLFKIRFRYAFWAIVLGVIIAATIVSLLTYFGILTYNHLAK
ncbi:MAG: small multi-drug export protein [Candidatus Omnitrophota bacterium]